MVRSLSSIFLRNWDMDILCLGYFNPSLPGKILVRCDIDNLWIKPGRRVRLSNDRKKIDETVNIIPKSSNTRSGRSTVHQSCSSVASSTPAAPTTVGIILPSRLSNTTPAKRAYPPSEMTSPPRMRNRAAPIDKTAAKEN
jgi:hypothetical protein